ncbi:MAG: hypothetical protein ABEJ74_04435 [Haloferacaceae archaeon]
MALAETVRLVAAAIGTLGGVLLFLEFFQMPSYVTYNEEIETYDVDPMPPEADEYTWIGRVGALCVSLGFALLFVATFLG